MLTKIFEKSKNIQAAAFTLGGMYTERALERIALSLDLRALALAALYPNFVDRYN